MKISINDLFDDLTVEQTNDLIKETVPMEYNEELVNRIKDKVFDKMNIENTTKVKKRIPFRRIIAIAAVLLIVGSATSVGAANHFMPDNSFNQYLELSKDVDYSTLGNEVDVTASSSGLDFSINQVLCDNDILVLPFKCPKYDGRYVVPNCDVSDDIGYFNVYVDGKKSGDSMTQIFDDEDPNSDMCHITIGGLKNVRNNSKIKIEFNQVIYAVVDETKITDDFIYETVDVDGVWTFEFNINRSNARKKLDVQDFTLDNGENYRLKNFVISPLGFRCEYRVYGWKDAIKNVALPNELKKIPGNKCTLFGENLSSSLSGNGIMFIELNDGTVISNGDNTDSRFDLHTNLTIEHDTFMHGDIRANFKSTINVDDIKKITLLDNVIYEA